MTGGYKFSITRLHILKTRLLSLDASRLNSSFASQSSSPCPPAHRSRHGLHILKTRLLSLDASRLNSSFARKKKPITKCYRAKQFTSESGICTIRIIKVLVLIVNSPNGYIKTRIFIKYNFQITNNLI